MCIIAVALGQHPKYPLIVAANRDEYYERPTAPGHFWQEAPDILAGKDLRAGGTWLGINHQTRWAAVSNIRGPFAARGPVLSRGRLVVDFLQSSESAEAYLQQVFCHRGGYSAFNLLVGDRSEVWFASSHREPLRLGTGIYAVSNADLDTPWPKVLRVKASLLQALTQSKNVLSPPELMPVLTNRAVPPDDCLPDTGIGLAWERVLSPIFVTGSGYGTRSSTVLLFNETGRARYFEQTYEQGVSSSIVDVDLDSG